LIGCIKDAERHLRQAKAERTIKKAVIPAAGLGTRLLSATKEQPKEMLPLFAARIGDVLSLKPMIQFIFEDLFDFGIREFFLVVGKAKRSIEDHFTPDFEFIHRLGYDGKSAQANELGDFYKKIENSRIVWVNQPKPEGFGHAVLQAEFLISGEPFLVHAGDTHILSRKKSIFERLAITHQTTNADATLVLQELSDPRQYGVAEAVQTGDASTWSIRRVVEKPVRPASKLAIMPVYVFNPSIFEAIRQTKAGKGGEIQLTDAIQRLIDGGGNVLAIKLRAGDTRMDIGIPETYWLALRSSYQHASK
jgi:UTP--glucose-1-phosphate uridylyltransferase